MCLGNSELIDLGSIKKEKTLKRIEIMETSLADYFELNNDDDTEHETEADDACTQIESETQECGSSSDAEISESEYGTSKPPKEISVDVKETA